MSNSPIGGDSPSSGAASRLKSYKNKGLDSVELRRQREEEGVQLRKQKRDEQVILLIICILKLQVVMVS